MEWNKESEEMLLIQAISNLEWKEMLSMLENSLWVPGLILGYFNPLHQNSHDLARVLCSMKSSFVGSTSFLSYLTPLESFTNWWERLSSWSVWEGQLRSDSSAWLCDHRFLVSRDCLCGLLKRLQYLSLVRVLNSCPALHLRNAIAVVVLYSVCNIANT